MRLLWFLLLLVPLHLLVGAAVAWVVQSSTDLDLIARQWVIVPAYIILASLASTAYLARFVIPDAQKAEFFWIKGFLGAATWAAFLIWSKLMVIYLGYLAPVETDFISAALLVCGTAVMIQFWWTVKAEV